VGAVIAGLLGLVDIIGVIVYLALPIPIFINVAILLLGALTIVGAVFAWRGARWGLWLVVVTRFLSLVPLILPLIAADAPPEVLAPTWIQLGITIIVIVLLIVGLARRSRR
jgi:hypothetical protein